MLNGAMPLRPAEFDPRHLSSLMEASGLTLMLFQCLDIYPINSHPKPCFFRGALPEVRSPYKTLPQHQDSNHNSSLKCGVSILHSGIPRPLYRVRGQVTIALSQVHLLSPYFSRQQYLLANCTHREFEKQEILKLEERSSNTASQV